MSGNTEFAAQRIAEEVPADLVRLVPVKAYPSSGVKKFLWGGKSALMAETPELMPYELDLAAYDRIVLGTPMWAGTFAPPLRTFIRQHSDELTNKKLAAFVCSSSGDAGKVFAKLTDELNGATLEATLSLTDPKDSRKRQDDESLRAFCSQLG